MNSGSFIDSGTWTVTWDSTTGNWNTPAGTNSPQCGFQVRGGPVKFRIFLNYFFIKRFGNVGFNRGKCTQLKKTFTVPSSHVKIKIAYILTKHGE